MALYFDTSGLDDSVGGSIPIDQLWSLEEYGKKMNVWDAKYLDSMNTIETVEKTCNGAVNGVASKEQHANGTGKNVQDDDDDDEDEFFEAAQE